MNHTQTNILLDRHTRTAPPRPSCCTLILIGRGFRAWCRVHREARTTPHHQLDRSTSLLFVHSLCWCWSFGVVYSRDSFPSHPIPSHPIPGDPSPTESSSPPIEISWAARVSRLPWRTTAPRPERWPTSSSGRRQERQRQQPQHHPQNQRCNQTRRRCRINNTPASRTNTLQLLRCDLLRKHPLLRLP